MKWQQGLLICLWPCPPLCVCVFKVMQLMKNRGLVSFCILTLSDDFFFSTFLTVCFSGKLSEDARRPCSFYVLQGNWIYHPVKQLYIHLHIFVRFHKPSPSPLGGPEPQGENCCFKLCCIVTALIVCSKFILALVLSHAECKRKKS